MENLIKKKDRQVMLILFNTISNEITFELDVEKTTKYTKKLLKGKEQRCSTSVNGPNSITPKRL